MSIVITMTFIRNCYFILIKIYREISNIKKISFLGKSLEKSLYPFIGKEDVVSHPFHAFRQLGYIKRIAKLQICSSA